MTLAWPRHPVVFAQEVLAIEDLAPGRLRLGIGPTGAARVEHVYGLTDDRPLAHGVAGGTKRCALGSGVPIGRRVECRPLPERPRGG